MRESLNLTQQQLRVDRRQGPPPCRDEAAGCKELVLAAARKAPAAGAGTGRCAGVPETLVGACKATCGACLATPSAPDYDPGRLTYVASSYFDDGLDSGYDPSSDDDPGSYEFSSEDPCFDAADMCAWWARSDPRVCEQAAGDLQRWWWVPVACRRSCGFCGPLAQGSEAEAARKAAGSGRTGSKVANDEIDAAAVAVAAATVTAAARFGLQVGEAVDGTARVAVFVPLEDVPGSCQDKEAGCASWATRGECSRNPTFMAETCPVSCKACPVPVALAQPLARVRLNNGVLLPTVGYGTAGLGDATSKTVRWALDAGYRHLDSAQAREWYREDLVGQALADFLRAQEEGAGSDGRPAGGEAGGGAGAATVAGGAAEGPVQRSDIFVTSKLHPRHLGYATTLKQFNESLKDLRTNYVDLFLLHYADCWGDLCGGKVPEGNFSDSWRALEELYDLGFIRAIGVSNFSPAQLSQLLASARVRPAVLQVHVDPLARNGAEQDMCRREGITLTAYSTLGTQWGGAGAGGNPVLTHPELRAMGQEAGANRSTAQVALRWALQQGLVVLPRSSNPERLRQNLDLYGWSLTPQQMKRIAHLRPIAHGG